MKTKIPNKSKYRTLNGTLTAGLQLILKPKFHLVKPGMSLVKPYSEKVAFANHKDVIQRRSCALLLGKNVNRKSTQQHFT